MKRNALYFLTCVGLVLTLGACNKGGNNSTSEEIPTSSQTSAPVIDQYTRDDADYTNEPLANTTKIRIHYHRNDNYNGDYSCYVPWHVYLWDYANGAAGEFHTFDRYDDFGVIAEFNIADICKEGYTFSSKFGIIISTTDWTKDVNADRYLEIPDQSHGGVMEFYLRTKIEKIFTDLKSATSDSLKYARFVDKKHLHIVFNIISENFTMDKARFAVKINDVAKTDFEVADYVAKTNSTDISFSTTEIKTTDVVTVSYQFSSEWTDSTNMFITNYFDTDEFISEYTYTGDDLGATFDDEDNPSKTTFKVWAPTSQKMVLKVFDSGDYLTDTDPIITQEMEYTGQGIWEYTHNADLDGKYYTYTVTNSAGTNEVVDPYAKSAGVNGRRGMVVNFTKLNANIPGWDSDSKPNYGTNPTDGSIYEIHVRDMTINPNSGVTESKRGTFAGLAESGTTYTEGGKTVTTGLDHLEELGITHVQIQPMYDYSSVDEANVSTSMDDDNYNWGYDPLNYNVLEGSYSTNPNDGYQRIKEFKQMVMAMHDKGININMDVVYNHTSSLDTSNFELLVPYYYHRFSTSGNVYNGSGCGNEMASERFMCNKFVRESCKFWTEEYHLSGFRFDLMGLMDNQIMIDIYSDLSAIDPMIMVYGEPWTGGTSKLKAGTDPEKLTAQTTVQSSLAQSYFVGNGKYVGAFNDVIRNAVRGGNEPGKGWVQGSGSASSLSAGIQGMFSSSASQIEPQQVLNYVSCHDNYSLYDQLVQTLPSSRDLHNAYNQAEAVVFTSQGVAFMQEGEDFLRTKAYEEDGKTKYEGNSYNVGDSINNMDYSLKIQELDTFNKFKELVALRKNISALTIPTRSEVSSAVKGLTTNSNYVSYSINYDGNEYFIIHALNSAEVALDGSYELEFDSYLVDGAISGTITGSINMGANQSVVLRKV